VPIKIAPPQLLLVFNRAQPAVNPDTGLENHGEMKKSLIVSAVAAAIVVAGFVGVAQAQKAKKVVYVSSEKATYTPRPGGGPAMHILGGDPDKGSHATFTKFEPGFDAGMHTHTNDVSCVVIKGAYLYQGQPAKSVSAPANIYSSPAATSIGAAATKPKAPSSTRKAPASST
jgi:hypothetical protein